MKNTIDNYTRWITPIAGDPTYSLLKAHLLFEELLRTYLSKVLPHASALDGSRLTFIQLLAVSQASSRHAKPDHWVWKAIGDLNRLRNMLSHEARPKALVEKLDAYCDFVARNMNAPAFPDPPPLEASSEATVRYYSKVDALTMCLYYATALTLGFNIQSVLELDEPRVQDIRDAVQSVSRQQDEA